MQKKMNGSNGPKIMETRSFFFRFCNFSLVISLTFGNNASTVSNVHFLMEPDIADSHVPDQPERLDVRPMSHSIMVSWVPNRRSKYPVRGYNLGYGKGVPDQFTNVLDANTLFYNIENIESSTEYVISIRAFNNKGKSPARYETVFTLEDLTEEKVILPPTGLKAIVLSPYTIALTWTDPSLGKEQRITEKRFYEVRVTSKFEHVVQAFLTKDMKILSKNLKPDTEYEFSVRVVNKGNMHSDWSLTVSNKTQREAEMTVAPLLPPIGLKAVVLSPFTIALTWKDFSLEKEQKTTDNRFYTIKVTQIPGHQEPRYMNTSEMMKLIDGIKPDTQYEFSVRVIVGQRKSEWSESVSNKTQRADNSSIRVVNGPKQWVGRLEIKSNGVWGSVFYDVWDISNALRICKSLGREASSFGTGRGLSQMSIRTIDCNPSDQNIELCTADFVVFDCELTRSKAVGIDCSGGINATLSEIYGGEVIFETNEKGKQKQLSVCHDAIYKNAAMVICSMVGYESRSPKISEVSTSNPVLFTNVSCFGVETHLLQCDTIRTGPSCDRKAAVQCCGWVKNSTSDPGDVVCGGNSNYQPNNVCPTFMRKQLHLFIYILLIYLEF